ncbi:MAG: hypothetical protein SFV53_03255 [Rickettsiales bacterium]|nr:hypothetical protein [Rickettsiales bacterium]
MNNVEIMGIAALLISSITFLSACFWAINYLDKDDKKPLKHKAKKA